MNSLSLPNLAFLEISAAAKEWSPTQGCIPWAATAARELFERSRYGHGLTTLEIKSVIITDIELHNLLVKQVPSVRNLSLHDSFAVPRKDRVASSFIASRGVLSDGITPVRSLLPNIERLSLQVYSLLDEAAFIEMVTFLSESARNLNWVEVFVGKPVFLAHLRGRIDVAKLEPLRVFKARGIQVYIVDTGEYIRF
ncbi:hypothetical protein BT96DRAFT_372534 [Gymnopus androsaceus JB14]|uniref:Uncharacterized protein n=1 Tax=Gymnopus androsaceus JB14 TaxID=1447944 RepID=A0A6A4IMU2_9AGAR|nr:hypothetical protein BT96DRAFT_372534 [Gymnopus androsaceus JB14]